jgi:hypothetical protein
MQAAASFLRRVFSRTTANGLLVRYPPPTRGVVMGCRLGQRVARARLIAFTGSRVQHKGGMFVVSSAHARQLLQRPEGSAPMGSLLDVGAGDGGVTVRIPTPISNSLAPGFREGDATPGESGAALCCGSCY